MRVLSMDSVGSGKLPVKWFFIFVPLALSKISHEKYVLHEMERQGSRGLSCNLE